LIPSSLKAAAEQSAAVFLWIFCYFGGGVSAETIKFLGAIKPIW
jgi:hypothetical protein